MRSAEPVPSQGGEKVVAGQPPDATREGRDEAIIVPAEVEPQERRQTRLPSQPGLRMGEATPEAGQQPCPSARKVADDGSTRLEGPMAADTTQNAERMALHLRDVRRGYPGLLHIVDPMVERGREAITVRELLERASGQLREAEDGVAWRVPRGERRGRRVNLRKSNEMVRLEGQLS